MGGLGWKGGDRSGLMKTELRIAANEVGEGLKRLDVRGAMAQW